MNHPSDIKAARQMIRSMITDILEGNDFIGKSASPVWALTQLQREQAELQATLDELQQQVDQMMHGDIDAEWERLAPQWAM
jgi:hypothetical protein